MLNSILPQLTYRTVRFFLPRYVNANHFKEIYMREKLETLSLMQLRDIAKSNGIKSVTTYRKTELIEKLLALPQNQQPTVDTSRETLPADTKKPSDNPSEHSESPVQNTDSIQENANAAEVQNQQAVSAEEPRSQSRYPDSRRRSYNSDSAYPPRRTFNGVRSPHSRIPSSGRPQSGREPVGRETGGRETGRPPMPREMTSRFSSRDPREPRDYSRPAGRDLSGAPSGMTGGYVRRTGGYTQSYNQIMPESSPRPYKSNYYTPPQEPAVPASAAPSQADPLMSAPTSAPYPRELAGSEPAHGILEVNPEGFGFLRSDNYLTGDNDVYVSPAQIRKFGMKTGDMIEGVRRIQTGSEKFAALLYINTINGFAPSEAEHRPSFEDLTPIFPDEKLSLETPDGPLSLRVLDLLAPIGKGQRGMIVSPPKAGKTTLLKDIAKAVTHNYPAIRLIVLLIDERPEEVTDIRECIEGDNVEVIYSTFDEQPEHHQRVAEMVLERAKRLVEHGQDVMILLDSITRLARACNLTVTPSGRTLSGGLDPAALHMPKKFFGAARNMREGGSLTILASALVDTGSRMDDVVFEEFKGTGNMELVLDRKLSERRIFPAIDICRSGTRREDLLLTPQEQEAVTLIRRHISSGRSEDAAERILDHFARTKTNQEFIESVNKLHLS